jgi:hypothetical protein
MEADQHNTRRSDQEYGDLLPFHGLLWFQELILARPTWLYPVLLATVHNNTGKPDHPYQEMR